MFHLLLKNKKKQRSATKQKKNMYLPIHEKKLQCLYVDSPKENPVHTYKISTAKHRQCHFQNASRNNYKINMYPKLFPILSLTFKQKEINTTTVIIEHYTKVKAQTCETTSTETREPFSFSKQHKMILTLMTLTAECLVLPR
jgi:hypothetical protein